MKYSVEVGSLCTRYVKRNVTVYAKDETEAKEKAIDKYIDAEQKLNICNDFGSPQVDSIEIKDS